MMVSFAENELYWRGFPSFLTRKMIVKCILYQNDPIGQIMKTFWHLAFGKCPKTARMQCVWSGLVWSAPHAPSSIINPIRI